MASLLLCVDVIAPIPRDRLQPEAPRFMLEGSSIIVDNDRYHRRYEAGSKADPLRARSLSPLRPGRSPATRTLGSCWMSRLTGEEMGGDLTHDWCSHRGNRMGSHDSQHTTVTTDHCFTR